MGFTLDQLLSPLPERLHPSQHKRHDVLLTLTQAVLINACGGAQHSVHGTHLQLRHRDEVLVAMVGLQQEDIFQPLQRVPNELVELYGAVENWRPVA